MDRTKFMKGVSAAMPTIDPPDYSLIEGEAGRLMEEGINTTNRVASFFANIGHESRDLTRLEESLYYTEGRMMEVWPSRFPTFESAQPYARNPQKLGNYVYANRMGNGNEASGDGYRFRGSGPIQLTGRYNFGKYGGFVGLDLLADPDAAREPKPGLYIALAYFRVNGIFASIDKADWPGVTLAINGGYNGHDDRERRTLRAISVMEGTVQRRTVRRGSFGYDVAEVQQIVGAKPEDGVFGGGTERDVKAWQEANGLVPDGIFGPASWRKASELSLV